MHGGQGLIFVPAVGEPQPLAEGTETVEECFRPFPSMRP